MVDDLFAYAEARQRRDAGMRLAAEAQEYTAPGFAEAAYAAILALARRQPEVHIDDFLRVCTARPHHPNVGGSIWRRAIANGVIEKTGRTRPCTVDPIKNAHDYPLYRSLIFVGRRQSAA